MQFGVLGWGRHSVGREARGAGRWSFSFESYLPPLSYIYIQEATGGKTIARET